MFTGDCEAKPITALEHLKAMDSTVLRMALVSRVTPLVLPVAMMSKLSIKISLFSAVASMPANAEMEAVAVVPSVDEQSVMVVRIAET